jgi:hypothetical protein
MNVPSKLYRLLNAADAKWQQRRRKINTASVFAALCSASLNRRGFEHIINADGSSFTAQALGQARAKLPAGLFLEMNKALQPRQSGETRVFAVDGSKVHVHPCFKKEGFKSRTNDKPVPRAAVRPLAMLSAMLDVHTRTCYDAVVSSHFNERTSAVVHMQRAARRGDTMIFDRGYFSKELLYQANKLGVNVLFRLKSDAFTSARRFHNSAETRKKAIIQASDGTWMNALLLKYYIDWKKYVCLTNFECTSLRARQLYALRWRVETAFRRLKTDLNLETSHSMSAAAFVQELEARVLLDTCATLAQQRKDSDKPEVSYPACVDACVELAYAVKACQEMGLPLASLLRVMHQINGYRQNVFDILRMRQARNSEHNCS